MLGQTNYPRVEDDHYPTPPPATLAYATHPAIRRLLAGHVIHEPACGNGAIVKVLQPIFASHRITGSDIKRYAGDYRPDGFIDFLTSSAEDLDVLAGQTVTALVTNPPYGKLAPVFVRHALRMMAPREGVVAVLCRHEWDAAKGRADLFDQPAFHSKLTLRFRPVWVEKKPGEPSASPRFSYAWYTWAFGLTEAAGALSLYAG